MLIRALKSNRILYPHGKRCPASEYALSLPNDQYHLVKVGGHEYWVHRYVEALNGIGHAVVLLSYPKNSFRKESALRLFLCSDSSLSDEVILSHYSRRWKIEVMFKQHKMYLGLKSFMVRSAKAIDRLLVILTLAHFFLSLSAFHASLSAGIFSSGTFCTLFEFAHLELPLLFFQEAYDISIQAQLNSSLLPYAQKHVPVAAVNQLLSDKTPYFSNFLNRVSGGNIVLQNRIWEMIGYILSRDTNGKVFFLLQGVPNSGKSILGRLIESFFPPGLVTSLSANRLGDRFSPTQMNISRLNMSMDLPDGKNIPICCRKYQNDYR